MKVGIIGGGQLARMLALAGYPLGLQFKVYDPTSDACAGQVAPLTIGAFDDGAALCAFAEGLDVVTFDFENLPAASLRILSERVRVAPGPAILEVAQDRLAEKSCAQSLGIPCGDWWEVNEFADLQRLLLERPGDYILKTRRFGYDGKGQVRIGGGRSLDAAAALLQSQSCVLEALVPFEREVSIVATRAHDGQMVFYPLTQNQHVDGVLRVSQAPAAQIEGVRELAETYVKAIADRFDYVGTLAVEFFQVGGRLLFNEIAPRVHNSGHWTIEGAVCSQFENHLRAICGWSLGRGDARFRCVMENYVGDMPPVDSIFASGDGRVHCYGKKPRPGRKVGHMTTLFSLPVTCP